MTCENCESLEQEIQCLEEEACMNDDENMRLNKEIERLRAENEALKAAQEWQPIETAPKGVPILGKCLEDYDQVIIKTRVDMYDDGPVYICESMITGRYVSATHWMPIPQPQKEQSE